MQPVSANPDFGTQSVSETISKSSRCIMHYRRRIDFAQESFRIKPGMTLKQIVATGQPLEARALVNGIRLYLTRQLDVHWGVVKQV